MTAIEAQGTTISFDGTVIGGITSFSGLDGSATEIDVTTLASTAKEFKMGLQDFGNFSFEMLRLFDDPGQIKLIAAKASRETKECIITFNDVSPPTKYTFDAFVNSVSLTGGVDGVLTSSTQLRVTGDVTQS